MTVDSFVNQSYTKQVLEAGIRQFLPMGETIIKAGNQALGLNYVEPRKLSKTTAKARIATARRIEQAIKEGRGPSLSKSVTRKMKARAKLDLAGMNTKRSILLGASSAIADKVVPGAGYILGNADQAKDIIVYAKESSDYEGASMMAFNLIKNATKWMWAPVAVPIAVGCAVVADSDKLMEATGGKEYFKHNPIMCIM